MNDAYIRTATALFVCLVTTSLLSPIVGARINVSPRSLVRVDVLCAADEEFDDIPGNRAAAVAHIEEAVESFEATFNIRFVVRGWINAIHTWDSPDSVHDGGDLLVDMVADTQFDTGMLFTDEHDDEYTIEVLVGFTGQYITDNKAVAAPWGDAILIQDGEDSHWTIRHELSHLFGLPNYYFQDFHPWCVLDLFDYLPWPLPQPDVWCSECEDWIDEYKHKWQRNNEVIDIEPWKLSVGQGYTISFDVTVKNTGTVISDPHVSLYAKRFDEEDWTLVDGPKIWVVNPGGTHHFTLTWDSAGLDKNEYEYEFNATIAPMYGEFWAPPVSKLTDVPGADDNTMKCEVSVLVTIPGDVDEDRDVDIFDIVKIGTAYGTVLGDPDYDNVYDIDNDEDVDIFDVMIAASHVGEIW